MRNKIVTILVISMLLFITGFLSPASSIDINDIRTQLNDDKPGSLFLTNSLSVDLKVRKSGDATWQDSISAKVGTILEFKISISSSDGHIMVVIQYPIIDEEIMLEYVPLSASETPLPVPVDEVTIWAFVDIPPSEITFKAKIKKTGSGSVTLNAASTENSELEDDDSVQVTGTSCCFPAGTKITMYDGTLKNIEDVMIGDKVLSYDFEKKVFSSWFVKMLGNPVHSVYDIHIDNGLIRATVDHPFYIKKTFTGKTGLGAIDAARSMDSISFLGDVLTLEVGDYLFTSDEQWVRVNSIVPGSEPIQTYNILSFSGTRNYFANGFLVYEEHPSYCYTNTHLENILEKHPFFTKILLSLPVCYRLLTPY